ncbi:MAG TPA: hypothetical protein GX505_03315 [Clostridiales bacterium]|nr:hypothetical protein [Clostridiales bacterium]
MIGCHTKGTLATGKDADIAIFDYDILIVCIIIRCKTV